METTLFNKDGKPVGYIAEDGSTIYAWDGRAVAYLEGDQLYGWNWAQLGWHQNGTIFDIFGYRAGFVRAKSPIPTQIEPPKPIKQAQRIKKMRQAPVVKPPNFIYGYSKKSLEELLERGAV